MPQRLAVTIVAAGLTVAAIVFGPSVPASAAGVVVSGTVSGSDQGFLSGASVAVDGPQHRATTTDADGRFTFTDVPPGRYTISVTAEKYVPLDRQMDVGDASVSMDIVLLRIPSVP